MKIKTTLIATLAVAALTLSACSGGGAPKDGGSGEPEFGLVTGEANTVNTGEAQEGTGTVTYALPSVPTNWNALTTTGNSVPSEVLASVLMPRAFVSLPDWTLEMNTDLLESAEVTSESPQIVTYKIKAEAQWHDGTPITADDFEYTWRAQNGKDCPDCDINEIGGYGVVSDVSGADDGKTVNVTFDSPYGEWQSLFKFIFPAHIAKEHGDIKASFGDYFVNTLPDWSGGPFIVDEYIKDESINLVPNPKWYGKAPNLDAVKLRIITDQAQWITALANDEISALSTEPNTDLVAELESMSPDGFKYQVSPGNRLPWLGFNLNDPKWEDEALRNAILTAVDMKSVIARTVGSFADFVKPSTSLLYLPTQEGYTDSIKAAGKDFGSGDVEAATKILENAGYTLKDKKLIGPDGKPVPAISLVTYQRLAFETLAQATADDLRAIGLTVNVNSDPSPYGNLVLPGNFDLSLLNWSMVPFAASKASTSWTAEGGSTAFTSDEIDTLIYDAMASIDQQDAIAKMQEADKLLLQSATALPYFQAPNLMAYKADLVNIRDDTSLNSGPTYNIQEWGVKAE